MNVKFYIRCVNTIYEQFGTFKKLNFHDITEIVLKVALNTITIQFNLENLYRITIIFLVILINLYVNLKHHLFFFRSSPASKQEDGHTNALEALEGFVIGLYSDVFNAVVSLINR